MRHPLAPVTAALIALAGTLTSPPAAAQTPPPAAAPAAAAKTPAPALRAPEAAGLIVKFRDRSRNAAGVAAAMQGARASAAVRGMAVAAERENALGARVLRFERRVPADLVRRLARDLQAADPTIEYAEPDPVVHPHFAPDDPEYALQWNLFEAVGGIDAPGAWALSQGAGARIAIVDTGVLPHADLAPNLLPGYDFITDAWAARDGNGRDADAGDPGDWTEPFDCDSDDEYGKPSVWHGTHVAGIAAAVGNNGNGVIGVAPKAKILPLRVLGRCGGVGSDVADAVIWAAGGSVPGVPDNPYPARVVNLSLGGEGACSATEQAAFDKARSAGALVVVSAGNKKMDASQYSPASCKGVLTVAATHRLGGKASYSNFGSVVGIAAPGGTGFASPDTIRSTYNMGSKGPTTDSTVGLTGTSMAAPHVAGVAALMFSVNSFMTAPVAAELMRETARAFPAACSGCGAGIVDAARAVTAARGFRLEVEPNGSRANAQYIGVFPADVRGTLIDAASNDHDMYAVWLPARATLDAKLSPLLPYDMNLYLYDANGQPLQSSAKGGPGASESITHTNRGAQATTLYLLVARGSGSAKSLFPQPYRLKLERQSW